MIERLREIRDKISLETMDMTFEEIQEYFTKRREAFEKKNAKAKRKYKIQESTSLAVAEPKAHYGKKK